VPNSRSAACQQGADLVGVEWLSEVEALPELAMQPSELACLLGGFDALGHRVQPEGMAQFDDRLGQGRVLDVVGDRVR
jgi:hypothetical protein